MAPILMLCIAVLLSALSERSAAVGPRLPSPLLIQTVGHAVLVGGSRVPRVYSYEVGIVAAGYTVPSSLIELEGPQVRAGRVVGPVVATRFALDELVPLGLGGAGGDRRQHGGVCRYGGTWPE